MNITLEYETEGSLPRKVWLGAAQSLTIGRAHRADLAIASDPLLADVHFSVTGLEHQWRIVAIRPDYDLSVNGKPVAEHTLQHGDLVQAGNTRFRVAIDGTVIDVVPDSRLVELPQATNTSARPLQFFAELLTSGAIRFSLKINAASVRAVLNALALSDACAGCHGYGLVNTKRYGKHLDGLVELEDDLLANAPAEIRETDSLHAVQLSPAFDPTVVASLEEAATSDAACFILSPFSYADYVEQHRLAWGWLTRPSILTQQLTVGSTMLVDHLLGKGEAIVTLSLESEVHLFTTSKHDEDDLFRQALEQISIPANDLD